MSTNNDNEKQFQQISKRLLTGTASSTECKAAAAAIELLRLPLFLSLSADLWPNHEEAINAVRRVLHSERNRYINHSDATSQGNK